MMAGISFGKTDRPDDSDAALQRDPGIEDRLLDGKDAQPVFECWIRSFHDLREADFVRKVRKYMLQDQAAVWTKQTDRCVQVPVNIVKKIILIFLKF